MILFKELYRNSCCLMNSVIFELINITNNEVNWIYLSDIKHKISITSVRLGRNTALARGRYYRGRPGYLYTRRPRSTSLAAWISYYLHWTLESLTSIPHFIMSAPSGSRALTLSCILSWINLNNSVKFFIEMIGFIFRC